MTTDVNLMLNCCLVFCSSKRAVDESEMEAAERRSLRCVWVTGGRALTEQEAAAAIVSEARLLLQEDLAQLGVQWDPTTLAPGVPALNTPDDSSSGSDSSSASYLHPHEEQMDSNTNHHKQDEFKTTTNGDTRRCGTENNAKCKREQERSKSEDSAEKQELEEIKQDMTEPSIKQMDNNKKLETFKETEKDDTNKKYLLASDKEDPVENRERQKQIRSKQEGQKTKESVSVRPETRQANVPERSLTQELSEILSSPFSRLIPLPQPSSTPLPPPRFRAPISRAEKQHSFPALTSNGEGSAGLVASPVQQGRLRHSRALSKVLNSIQTDKRHQDNIQTAQTLHSNSTTVSAIGSVQEKTARVSTPTNVDKQDAHLSASPAAVPLFSPEAKRRRIDGGCTDDFSSPELYTANERDENVEGAVKKEGESFGDSFELDTQTERLIVQPTSQHRDRNHKGVDQLAETEKITEEEMAAELEKDANEGEKCLNTPHDACPRFNISLTDSQMELILNTSQQVSHQNNGLLIKSN